jgi:protein-disulfide isomerase
VNKKTWIIFIVVCIGVLGGLVFLSRQEKADVADTDQNKILAATAASGNIADHTLGDPNSKVTLIEYGDFQCPYCGTAHPNVKKITEEYGSKIAFVFRNYPLPAIHANAKSAASAAEAAGLQGKYWEMHDKLYENQSQWQDLSTEQRTSQFVEYAKMVGVTDTEKFKTDMGGSDVSKKINFDLALGNKAKVTGTPAFFLNGKLVPESVSSSVINGDGSEMKKAIDELLK